MSDPIDREETINRIDKWYGNEHYTPAIISIIEEMPSADVPQVKEMTNSEWKEFLAKQWGVSKACAKEMLHAMYAIKEKDSIKKGIRQAERSRR